MEQYLESHLYLIKKNFFLKIFLNCEQNTNYPVTWLQNAAMCKKIVLRQILGILFNFLFINFFFYVSSNKTNIMIWEYLIICFQTYKQGLQNTAGTIPDEPPTQLERLILAWKNKVCIKDVPIYWYLPQWYQTIF